MSALGPIIAVIFIVLVAILLIKKFYPHAVLLFAGLAMLVVSYYLDYPVPVLTEPTGFFGFDLFRYISGSFAKTNAGVGLMIMAIGGFVAYIDKIGASKSLVYIALKPLSLFKKRPYIAASLVIPIGQILFVCIPSAAGLGLLLMASVFPILINLGVSRLSAVSVITACTAFGIGPASAITASATTIIDQDAISFFLQDQIPLVIPLSISMMVTYYFVNRYFDKKDQKEGKPLEKVEKLELTAPLYYAIIPVLPLVLLIVFSEIFSFFETAIVLDTTTAMFISLFVALVFELLRKRNFREVLVSLKEFWNGMGNIFKTVVTLIIAADIFSKGLISLGFIDGLMSLSQHLGLGGVGIGIVLSVMIFLASMLMGSGNASFFSFGPLVPNIAQQLGVKSSSIILPMQLSASMGRTVSPVAGVLIAAAELAKVSTFSIVKRNLIPLGVALIIMLIYHFI
ncbi:MULTISPECIES: C4-dicarboxylate transporter DcuC [Mesonia]|uniref:Cryptic C4-dicarboxylate transporter DcuD n=1 Tax=Mesonia oceanica TaxID=2687242 RepID=A0AC61Y6N8_9FLAO|nr:MULTISPECIES: C4-dicarboxylate transporter DcuC [Mesonia]MAN28266.1 C4-dicarboxylate ABC transporter [Mesonia sp.]MAQ41477.1 C4-dicarboxylate ABC transporter [Mesonia sp.]VVU99014.1 Putative cryptic C4-dicarboxylate transporter DcuD [Mesonia oceanica]|tara:strand:+ start:1078 stop:2442 length:1365 start_codon:yes stop_codon:yes gene_type:complete